MWDLLHCQRISRIRIFNPKPLPVAYLRQYSYNTVSEIQHNLKEKEWIHGLGFLGDELGKRKVY